MRLGASKWILLVAILFGSSQILSCSGDEGRSDDDDDDATGGMGGGAGDDDDDDNGGTGGSDDGDDDDDDDDNDDDDDDDDNDDATDDDDDDDDATDDDDDDDATDDDDDDDNNADATVFFSGTDENFTKIVEGDAGPGFAYGDSQGPLEVTVVDVAGQEGLPEGVTKALQVKTEATTALKPVVFGWNFRENKDNLFQMFDASAYEGVTFWAKLDQDNFTEIAVSTFTAVDSTNLPSNGSWVNPGECPAEEIDGCNPVTGTSVIISKDWQKFDLFFEDFEGSFKEGVESTGLALEKLFRLDIVYLAPNVASFGINVTGIELF